MAFEWPPNCAYCIYAVYTVRHTASVSIYLSVYIVYTHLNKSKLLLESIDVSICAIDYLSNT
jgi:hypothetical protein